LKAGDRNISKLANVDPLEVHSIHHLQLENSMKKNAGNVDRALRVVIGLALIGLTVTGTIGVWGWIGIVPIATAAMGFCPLYSLLGMNTCPMEAKKG
jgi:hypothetical protein